MAGDVSDDLSIPNAGYQRSPAGHYGMGRMQRRRGMDPDTRRLIIYAGGVGVVLVTLLGASALIGGRHGGGSGIPVVDADPRPIREKPANPGGMKVDGAENDVFSGGSDRENVKLAAPAETPNARALTAEATPAPANAASPLAEAPKAATLAPPPVVEAPKPAPAARAVVEAPQPATHPVAEAAKPAVAAAPPPPALKPQPVAAAQPVAKPETKPAPAGHMAVQFASVGSEDAAKGEWQRLTKRFPDLLRSRQPAFTRFEKDGKLFWRVRTAGFADSAAAKTFCEQFRIQGGDCKVADF